MIELVPDPEIKPDPEVYRLVISLFTFWEDDDKDKDSVFYIRLCQIANDLSAPDTIRVLEILEQEEFPDSQEIEYVALTLAQRAFELDYDPDW